MLHQIHKFLLKNPTKKLPRKQCRTQKVREYGTAITQSWPYLGPKANDHKNMHTENNKSMGATGQLLKSFSLIDAESKLNLISWQRFKTVLASTNQTTQGINYVSSVGESSLIDIYQYIYERPRAKYHSGSLWKLWRMWKRKNITQVLSSIPSKPFLMGSDVLFWCVWRQRQCTYIKKNKSLKKKKERKKEHDWV